MISITKENAKNHCRTCLIKLKAITSEKSEDLLNGLNLEFLDEDENKDNINIQITTEMQEIIEKYIAEKRILDVNYPDNLCFICYSKLQSFIIFRRQAQECAAKLHLIFNNLESTSNTTFDIKETDEKSKIGSPDDIYKLLLRDSLMETESILLDSCGSVALASTTIQDPDPFDTSASTPLSKVIVPNNNSDTEHLWQECAGSVGSSSHNDSSSDESGKEKHKSDHENDTIKQEEKITRLRPRRIACETITLKMEKKKRRTKKEMEEWRRLQTNKAESKIKRRNKGTKNNYKCRLCNHCFAHKITLDAHIRKVHEGSKRPFQCDRCDKAYTFIGGLYTHIKEIHETEVRSYACDYSGCDRIYTSFIAMQKHKRLKHTDLESQKKYVCEQCGATFNQSGNLKYHRKTKHPTEAEQAEKEKCKERFECTVCNKLFHSRYTLKYHTLQLHSNDMKYECNVCGRRMAKKFMLVQHMLVHSTEKMPCEHCGKQFIRKFELEAHIRAVHMKLKPFECQYCSECFASRKTLRHHEYIHTGEKPYVCDICGQAYRQQTCLKNHRKSHEKLTPSGLLAANISRTLMNTLLAPQQPTVSNANFN
ncbi:zinc finger protein 724-like [Teleopsis dalmanni]|uniref:zinc finger protein 724-like n=1 Tax=Teleopsis dalmanni TaxID=139649 RepID=UPI000D329B5D|nr:zinc finger protein 724-like [Teleopsis dalmanni]